MMLLLFTLHALLYHVHSLSFAPSTSQAGDYPLTVASSSPSSSELPASSALASPTPPANASTSSGTSSSVASSTGSTIDPSTLHDIWTVQARRLSSIIGAVPQPTHISAWLATLNATGKWPDSEVDYTTGCMARRANWPAQGHWQRILVMAAAWRGGLEGADQYVKSQELREAISNAMGYWFSRDFTNPACLDSGGTDQCPCDNLDNSLWNTNWFSNLILIPELSSQTCLLLNDTLLPAELNHCTHLSSRSYAALDRSVNGVGILTGANALDVAKIGIDQGLLTFNVSMLIDAYRRVHLELQVEDGIKVDGIRADGSFAQHDGILYNGNYGKDYTNDVLDLEVEAGNTAFAAGTESQFAFAGLFEGDKWMIFRNAVTGVLHWDFSALGRFISFPVLDLQATSGIKINLTEVLELGHQWSSAPLINFANNLSTNTTNANAGGLVGNRIFYDSDYMVHRGRNYVSTVKMYSTRTQNTECVNSQNPLGFHLSDGVQYTYLRGDEYEDIAAAWDWNLIPGITVDYQATPLSCSTTQQTGVEPFVGGVSDGKVGIAVMKYTNPVTRSLHFQKTWFFLEDDVQHVMISGLTSTTNASVFSVLDQKRRHGVVIVNGGESEAVSHGQPQSLWHDDVGYTFPDPRDAIELFVQVGKKTGVWSAIGTSTRPPATVDLFTAYIEHKSFVTPVSYTAFPGTSYDVFQQKAAQLRLQSVQNDQATSAIYDAKYETAMIVFWNSDGGTSTFTPNHACASITVTANGNIALVYRLETGEVTVSDPSQTLSNVRVVLALGLGRKPKKWGQGRIKALSFDLPSGGIAGNSTTQTIN